VGGIGGFDTPLLSFFDVEKHLFRSPQTRRGRRGDQFSE